MKTVRFNEAKMQDGFLCIKPKEYCDKIAANELCYEFKGDHVAEIKKHYEKRSLNANALFWKGCGEIAAAVGRDNWSIYLDLLRSYGEYTYIIVKPQAVEKFKQTYRLCEEVGEVEINGKKGVQLLCFYGQSTYDKKQMSRLIDGMMQEIKSLGIDFVPDDEISRAISEWEAIEK
jgi:hypothetical protein